METLEKKITNSEKLKTPQLDLTTDDINVSIDGDFVSFSLFNPRDRSDWAKLNFFVLKGFKKEIVITNYAVDEFLRGKGIGKLLMQKLKQFAEENEIPDVKLAVDPTDPEKVSLDDLLSIYRRFGFSFDPNSPRIGVAKTVDLLKTRVEDVVV